MKKFTIFIFSIVTLLAAWHLWSINTATPALAQAVESKPITTNASPTAATTIVPIEIFVRDDCQHCRDEKAFLEQLASERTDFVIHYHNIADPLHRAHWEELTNLENIPKVTPITLVANTIIQGFDTAETTGQRIRQLLDQGKGIHSLDFAEYIAAGGSGNVEAVHNGTCDESAGCTIEDDRLQVRLPIIGTMIDVKKYSLPALAAILGFVDGFNPCAMWVLVTFLVLLAQAGSRRKMWQFAGLFIVAEALMYYLILNFWMTAWDFVGLDNVVTPLVGALALASGAFFLWQWRAARDKGDECKVTDLNDRQKISARLRRLVTNKMTIPAALGIIGIAFSVNVIEFACSVGIPQAFTKILDLNALTGWLEQLYMSIYIFFYMVDDFIVFGIALYSFEKIGLTSKYSRWSHLIGGLLMLALGVMLIWHPDWLA